MTFHSMSQSIQIQVICISLLIFSFHTLSYILMDSTISSFYHLLFYLFIVLSTTNPFTIFPLKSHKKSSTMTISLIKSSFTSHIKSHYNLTNNSTISHINFHITLFAYQLSSSLTESCSTIFTFVITSLYTRL